MKRLLKIIQTHPFVVLFAISLATRILWSNLIIPSITDDEMDIYNSAFIFAKTGHDYLGNTFFLTSGILTGKPVIPILIATLPWFFSSHKTVFLARLPFVIFNSIIPLLIYYLVHKLTKNKRYALLSFLVINFSPWFSYISVTGYEAIVSLFFMLGLFCICVSDIETNKKIVLFLLASFCAFNSYMGIKPVFPFILSIGFLLCIPFSRITFKKIVQIGLMSLGLYAIFIATNYLAPNSERVKLEYSLMMNYYEKPKIEGMVWYERWTSQGPAPLVMLLSNKYTIRLRDHVSKYMKSFDPQIFFQKGEPSPLYGTADLSGLFFLSDFVFFIIALLHLTTIKSDKKIYLLFGLIFVGGIPVALSNANVSFLLRGIVLIIPYTILIAYGMEQVWSNKLILRYCFTFFTLLLICNSLLFITLYRVRVMNLNGEEWRYSFMKIIKKTKNLEKDFKSIDIYNQQAQEFFLQYAFYEINDPNKIISGMRSRKFADNTFHFLLECPKTLPDDKTLIVYNSENCPIPHNVRIIEKIEPLNRSGKDYYLYTGKSVSQK